MKKLKSLIVLVLLVCSCVIFASCKSKVESIEFEQNSIVLEIGQTYEPAYSILPESSSDVEVVLESKDSSVASISGRSIVAVGVGSTQIIAKTENDKQAILIVEVILEREQLSSPISLTFDSSEHKINWAKVENANSYDVEINGQLVAEKIVENSFMLTGEQTSWKVRVKANGIGKYKDSEYSQEYSFVTLCAPTNVVYNKDTQILSWEHSSANNFRVCVDKVYSEIITGKSYSLTFAEAGEYNVSVIAVSESAKIDGVDQFDSLKSESVEITRLDNVNNSSIVWNSSEKLLTWSKVFNASYIISIDDEDFVDSQENFLKIENLEKGNHEFKIIAYSDQDNVLPSYIEAEKTVAITEKYSTPSIVKFEEATNKLFITNIGEAQIFQVYVNGEILDNFTANTTDIDKFIILPAGLMAQANEYNLQVKATDDLARFYVASSSSEPFKIVRLDTPSSSTKINNGTTFAFDTLEQAICGYEIVVNGEIYTPEHPELNLFDLVPNQYVVQFRYLGNGNNILASEYQTKTLTKLNTPVLSFDKNSLLLTIDREENHKVNIEINGISQNNIMLNAYDLKGLLKEGANTISVQTVSSSSEEIASDITSIEIEVLSQVSNLKHYTQDDFSYISLDKNEKFDSFEITLNNEEELLSYIVINDQEDKIILKLTTNTSQLFSQAGTYYLNLLCKSTNIKYVDPNLAKIQITKLAVPSNMEFVSPNIITWEASSSLSSNFNIVVLDERDNEIINEDVESISFTSTDFTLGNLKAIVKALGNNQDILDSDYSSELDFTYTQNLLEPQLVYNKASNSIEITNNDNRATTCDIYVDDMSVGTYTEYAQTINYNFSTDFDVAGEHIVKVVLSNDSEFLISAQNSLTITKLSAPSGFFYENDEIIWNKVAKASGYSVSINSNNTNVEFPKTSTLDLEPGEYPVSIIATSEDNLILNSASLLCNLKIRKTLSMPTNVQYNKATNTLSFDEVTNATGYEIYINDSKLVEISTNSYTFNADQFDAVGIYSLCVKAVSNNAYRDASSKSESFVVERLSAPESINISDDEIVTCVYDLDKSSGVEISIEGNQTNDLKNFTGVIKIKVRYIGNGNHYLDSGYGEFTRTRLSHVSNLRIDEDKIKWDTNAYCSGYSVSVQRAGDSSPQIFNVEKNIGQLEYNFTTATNYQIVIYAVGDKTEFLNSYTKNLIVKKATTPINLYLEENPQTNKITLSFECDAEDILNYEVFVNGESIGTTNTTSMEFNSSILGDVGYYSVQVQAIGNNSLNTISSDLSEPFWTQRLDVPSSFGMNYNYYVEWSAVNSQARYKVTVFSEIDSVKTIIKSSQAQQANYLDFSNEATSEEFKDIEGTIQVSLSSVGNNSTLLNSLITTTYPIKKTSKIIVTSDANKVYFTRTDESCTMELTVIYNGNESAPIVNTWYGWMDEFEIPQSWQAGEYKCIVRQIKAGEFVSGQTIYIKNRLNNVNNNTCTITRDEDNEDILNLSWDAVENASGYLVEYSSDIYQSNLTEIYRGTATTFALPDDLPAGQIFFWFTALGSSENGFSSNKSFLNKIKLNEQTIPNVISGLNVRNVNGKLTWDAVSTSICSGYKIVVNGDYENAIKVDNSTLSCDLFGYSGQLSIKIKALGDLELWGLDSGYVELNIYKLPTPNELCVKEGRVDWANRYNPTSGETVYYQFIVGDNVFQATDEGIEEMINTLLSGVNYNLKVQAYNYDAFLTSDQSSELLIQVLENPNSNNGSTYISTNQDKTISYFNWASAVGAGKYEVKIIGQSIEPITQKINDTNVVINGLDAGEYQIMVKRLGQTGAVNGVSYISSGYSSPINFTVLQTPEYGVYDGQLIWGTQTGASNYYIYDSGSFKACGNVSNYTFIGEYMDYNTATNIDISLQAIGDGIEYLASAKTSTIQLVKPRPPQMLSVKDGALTWTNSLEYTYYDQTQNKRIYLDFMQNGITYDSFEIDASLVDSGWPFSDDYLEKITQNLPAGDYQLKIKQIGDSNNVITSEYNQEVLNITVAPCPTNVFIDEHKLQWDAVALENYNEDNEVKYVVYVFNTNVNDWVYLTETEDTSLDVENTSGILKPWHSAITVATKGNTTGDGYTNFVTGNMSNKINIMVLDSTNDIQTVEGNLAWGVVSNAVNYRIESEHNNIVVLGNTQSSYLQGFIPGVHNIRIRALGNGTSLGTQCIINGVWGDSSKFTKLESAVLSTDALASDMLMWGLFKWESIANNFGYNVYVNSTPYTYVLDNLSGVITYESDVDSNEAQQYNVQVKGNSVIPSEQNIAYVSSDLSNGLTRIRMQKIDTVMVLDGVMYWSQSMSNQTPRYYFVEFYQDEQLINKVCVKEQDDNVVQLSGRSMVKFDVAGYITDGVYTVLVKEVCNSSTWIIGLPSDPLEISKLEAPKDVQLINGILNWKDVENATGYILKLTNTSTNITTEVTDGFSFNSETNTWSWASDIVEGGIYKVCVRAISTNQNLLSSSWANKAGEMITDISDWVVYQIPRISLNNIQVDVGNSGYVTWAFSDSTNVPTNIAYIVWRTGDSSYLDEIIEEPRYLLDETLRGVKVRAIPYGENDYDYFASVFSEEKQITRPDAPTGLTFDTTTQTFSWDKVNTSDAEYIVCYSVNGGQEQELTTQVNKFEPSTLGTYLVAVKVKKSNSSIGISEKCESVEGEFNLFSSGEGTSQNPFKVNNSNFENIQYRTNAYFKLIEDITRTNKAPMGYNTKTGVVTSFTGKLDGDNYTITVSFESGNAGINIGLFARLGDGAEIKNINFVVTKTDIDLSVSKDSQVFAGIVAGEMNGNSAVIDNCSISGDVVIFREETPQTTFGGFVGKLTQGTIKNSSSLLNISSEISYISKVGGIAGLLDTNGKIVDCENRGNISDANTVGGIVAENYGMIQSCENYGTISSDAKLIETTIIDSIVGGIAGKNIGETKDSAIVGGIILDCVNSGTLVLNNTTQDSEPNAYAGGIVGWLSSGKIDNNRNSGSVQIGTMANGTTYATYAIFGYGEKYTQTSTNYKLSSQSQQLSGVSGMTILDI